jgi:hypothetical protein
MTAGPADLGGVASRSIKRSDRNVGFSSSVRALLNARMPCIDAMLSPAGRFHVLYHAAVDGDGGGDGESPSTRLQPMPTRATVII